MGRIALVLYICSSIAWAHVELWVIYHQGCPSCENFLDNVIPTYPLPSWQKNHKSVPIKLLNAGFPLHQQLIRLIEPPVFSTPTFLYVNTQGETAQVLERWAGFKDTATFYDQLSQAMKNNSQALEKKKV